MSWLEKLPEAQRVEAFYRLWNCNEALYKLQHSQGRELQAINAGWNCRILPHVRLGICLCSAREVSVVNIVELDVL